MKAFIITPEILVKNILLVTLIFTCALTSAQNNCSQFYISKKGTKTTLHHFNHKNKLTSKTSYQVLDVNTSGTKTNMTMSMELNDAKKDKPIIQSQFKITCDGGTIYLDPESIISPKLFHQYKGMEYSIDGENISIPNTLTVGMQLPDGLVKMSIDAGVMSIDMDIHLKNRKVEAKEMVQTPAGNFECYLISYTNKTTMSMGMSQTYYVKQWVAKGAGLIKQETKKTNGKLMSKSILVKLE